MNEFIDLGLCSVSYTSFDTAVRWVRVYGRGAKTDIDSTFRLVPMHPDIFQLLGGKWLGCYFIDQCLPMGCSISCSLFETLVLSLSGWSGRCLDCRQSSTIWIILCIGPAVPNQCRVLLATVQQRAERIGIPLAADKTEGPASVLSFSGYFD